MRFTVNAVSKILLVAATSVTLAVAGQGAAGAATPGLTVTPATGLTTGDTVSVAVTGFAAGEPVAISECAEVTSDDAVACNGPEGVAATADANGTVTVSLVVRNAFQGYTQDGQLYGPVDCATAFKGCVVGAVNGDGTTTAGAPITFK
jgi:hypothetical protein